MASFNKCKLHKKAFILLLVLSVLFSSTGCANIVNNLGFNPNKDKIKIDVGGDEGEIPEADLEKKEDTKHREKKMVDYSTDRFNIGGTNAFYILPGIENIPDAMAVFKVLDYNSMGEFVYYYVTPCYTTPEAFAEYVESNRTGIVKARSSVSAPEGRREDYEYDAGVLMSYNPDTGLYRIMYADTFKIDKEHEFDPATEGRPYMYKGRDMGEDGERRVYMEQRLLGCKIAAREEYLLLDQNTLTGVVYDARGKTRRNIAFRNTLNNEIDNKKDIYEFDRKKDHGNKKIMNVSVTGLAMTFDYESYMSATFFMGDADDDEDISEEDLQVSSTFMIFRQPVNRNEGGIPFVSINKNAEKQKEKWLSLDKKFFTSKEELEAAQGYSMTDLKRGIYGTEYADDFTPFMSTDSDENGMSFLVKIPNYYALDGSWYDNEFTNDLMESARNNDLLNEREWILEQFKSDAKVISGGSELDAEITRLYFGSTVITKRLSQIILGDALLRRMRNEKVTEMPPEALQSWLEEKKFLPKPGFYRGPVKNENINDHNRFGDLYEKQRQNVSPPGYCEHAQGSYHNKVYDNDPMTTIVSDHVVSVASYNGIYYNSVGPIDYNPEDEEPDDDNTNVGITMETAAVMEPIERTVYVYDIQASDAQIAAVKSQASLSDSEKKAVDELKLLLRTSASVWGNVKLGWLLKEIVSDQQGLANTVSQDAAKAKEEGRISEEQYKKITEILEKFNTDGKVKEVHNTFERAREDAKKKHDEGGLSDKEYEDALNALNEAEQKKLGLSDEDWKVFESLVATGSVLADAKKTVEKAGSSGNRDMIARIEDISKNIPESIRDEVLYLCAGFSIKTEKEEGIATAYETVFPEGSAVIAGFLGQVETVGGFLCPSDEGVVIAAESDGKKYNGNTFVAGYKNKDELELLDIYVCGKPMDLGTMEYDDGKEKHTIVVVCTDKGVKFLRKNNDKSKLKQYDNDDLKDKIGKTNANLICGLDRKERNFFFFTDYDVDYNDKATVDDIYSPLPFIARGDEAYESIVKTEGRSKGTDENDFIGFLTYKMLLTSSGYTRDIEDRITQAVDESLGQIGAKSENIDDENRPPETNENDRFIGHLNSAENICLIAKNKALICSATDGTKILDLDYGTVANDLDGAYFRAYQIGSKKNHRLLGFADTTNSYLDVDLPLAKIYTKDYSDAQLNRTEIDAFKKMLMQYAKDYLYREYRTLLNGSNKVVIKEKTSAEKKESIEAGKIFDPSVKDFEEALLELENKFGIEETPQEIREYTADLRDKIALVAPTITRIYELAGAGSLAGDSAKRNTGYWKNVESRMTMAVEINALKDILVEIRMHDDVLPSLSADQAAKYKTYKSVLDLANEHLSVSAGDIFKRTQLSENEADSERMRLRNQYRSDVLKDITAEYGRKLSQGTVSGQDLLTDQEIQESFDDYVRQLLNRVNPDNFILEDEKMLEQFADIVNHGKEKLTGKRFEEFKEDLTDDISDLNSVWELEEMIIRKKIEEGGVYSGYQEWLNDYDTRVLETETKGEQLKVPTGKKKDGKTGDEKPLTGNERVSYLRTSPAYKEIIGDIRQDQEVKDFLYERRETWNDYCAYVLQKAGLGASDRE